MNEYSIKEYSLIKDLFDTLGPHSLIKTCLPKSEHYAD